MCPFLSLFLSLPMCAADHDDSYIFQYLRELTSPRRFISDCKVTRQREKNLNYLFPLNSIATSHSSAYCRIKRVHIGFFGELFFMLTENVKLNFLQALRRRKQSFLELSINIHNSVKMILLMRSRTFATFAFIVTLPLL